MTSDETTVFQDSSLSLAQKLERARSELLDLSARNRLLNIPRSKSSRYLDVIDERSEQIYRLLVSEKKAFTFLHGKTGKVDSDNSENQEQEEDDTGYHFDEDSQDIKSQHLDTRLQTRLTPKGLQQRLLDLYHDSKTLEEEQGVNLLYLALGMLKWVDPINKDNIRYAPLILIPVMLERGNAGERFKLKTRGDDIIPNLSLEAFLERIHHIALPEMHLDENDEINVSEYIDAVAHAVSLKADWEVKTNDITLGLFSYAKFLMYRDLDPENWPKDESLIDKKIISALMEDGFEEREDLLAEDCPIDPLISPKEMLHIMDSDSSQTLAIHDVRRGKNLVIQGPPGTGKSQTIANIIATAIADGKTVLFVAEKMAALDVVKRRLDQSGVGDACLELHSNKANKRLLLEELKRVWELGSPRGEYPDELIENLTEARDSLNAHPARLHKVYSPSGLTPFQVMGQLVRLRQQNQTPIDLKLEQFENWNNSDLTKRIALVKELVERLEEMGLPSEHPWYGVGLEEILPGEVDRLIPRLETLNNHLLILSEDLKSTAKIVAATPEPDSLSDVERLLSLAKKIHDAPALSPLALASPVWSTSLPDIRAMIDLGKNYAECFDDINGKIHPGQADTPLLDLRDDLKTVPDNLQPSAFSSANQLIVLIPKIQAEVERLTQELGTQPIYHSLKDISRLLELSSRVADAPDASPEAFIASVWEYGVEQASGLVHDIIQLKEIKIKLGSQVVETAWGTDVSQVRHNLAVHTGLLRFMNAEWRHSRTVVRSLLRDPSLPLTQQLEILGHLIKAQALSKKITETNDFGANAFSHHWRGENSDCDMLKAVVEWMATLKDVGPEARLLASRLSDRDMLRHLTNQLKETAEQVQSALKILWKAHGISPEQWFDNHFSFSRVPLAFISTMGQKLVRIDAISHQVLRDPAEHLDERLLMVEEIISLQYLKASVASHQDLAITAFAELWQGPQSDWKALEIRYEWIKENPELRFIAATIDDREALLQQATALYERSSNFQEDIRALAKDLASTMECLFSVGAQNSLSITHLREKLSTWILSSEQLSKWVMWQHRVVKGCKEGLTDVIDQLADGRLPLHQCQSSVEYAYYESLLRLMVSEEPSLARFDGELHSRKVSYFADLDLRRIKASSIEVVRAHHRRIPSKTGAAGPVGVLRAEMARKRGHLPIRQLMLKAGPAIQALKPVIMMSPLSVAQFLTPGKQKFDLLVMDEASQIQPVDAIGAIARCQQVVVVGDERQLPPTSFFSRMTEVSNDDDDSSQVADIESILGLFVARGLPQRMLRWHYRSRHQSLIAVSNNQFYENKLFIVPSPYTQEAGMGLLFHHIPEGIFDSGGSNANLIEAKRIASSILVHAQKNPDQSLGVATFSVSQRKAIQDELELLRRLNPQCEEFFMNHPNEPFFIKNLENIQGDERDVIMISVGYARNKQGYLAMRFGPLGSQGGERRLNVLISRAKRRCEVFASITDEDIDLERAKGVGVFAFKLFLQYARTGRLSLSHQSGKPMDSIFEEQVASALQQKGYQVHAQVGIAGFFIDLAIADPEMPGRYLLGIECDGSAYHSSRSARERDRLRQSVLEDHGWIIHRIWSTDWFQRPDEQLQRVLNAIDSAKKALAHRIEQGYASQRAVPVEIVTVEREDVVELGLDSAKPKENISAEYNESAPVASSEYELHETPVGILSDLIEKIVLQESPVHINEVIVRLRTAWGLQRAGARIDSTVRNAAAIACKKGLITFDGDFLLHKETEIQIRNRQNVSSTGLRKPEMIHPREIAEGVLAIVAHNLGATEDEIVTSVSRMLGFKATSSALKRAITDVIGQCLAEGKLLRNDLLLVAPEPTELISA
ncbi:MAG TPA: DUF3320 domain-containing protein [Scandinavium sp.]|jgi:very-short-patch-repair endonuclease|uniref:DUF3320 domain-containing protein n=1 Tax=Scandinavium sp. TaxID=2830653 RepID=UPI002E3635D7|nr:DUF3320 domain-containing protein [Scandinavium sp.]HEX4501714.1 DUF3320 domain-containing protein [Scandinavium sp.]